MQQLSLLKESVETFQAILTCGALIAGGVWTYYTYIYKREKVPRALIEPVALSFLSSEGIYISVSVIIKNIGSTLIRVKKISVRIQQILPICDGYIPSYFPDCDSTEFGWPTLAVHNQEFLDNTLEIEPSETHQFLFDFLIDPNIKLIKIYSFSQYHRNDKNELGWSVKILHSFAHLRFEDLVSLQSDTTLPR